MRAAPSQQSGPFVPPPPGRRIVAHAVSVEDDDNWWLFVTRDPLPEPFESGTVPGWYLYPRPQPMFAPTFGGRRKPRTSTQETEAAADEADGDTAVAEDAGQQTWFQRCGPGGGLPGKKLETVPAWGLFARDIPLVSRGADWYTLSETDRTFVDRQYAIVLEAEARRQADALTLARHHAKPAAAAKGAVAGTTRDKPQKKHSDTKQQVNETAQAAAPKTQKVQKPQKRARSASSTSSQSSSSRSTSSASWRAIPAAAPAVSEVQLEALRQKLRNLDNRLVAAVQRAGAFGRFETPLAAAAVSSAAAGGSSVLVSPPTPLLPWFLVRERRQGAGATSFAQRSLTALLQELPSASLLDPEPKYDLYFKAEWGPTASDVPSVPSPDDAAAAVPAEGAAPFAVFVGTPTVEGGTHADAAQPVADTRVTNDKVKGRLVHNLAGALAAARLDDGSTYKTGRDLLIDECAFSVFRLSRASLADTRGALSFRVGPRQFTGATALATPAPLRSALGATPAGIGGGAPLTAAMKEEGAIPPSTPLPAAASSAAATVPTTAAPPPPPSTTTDVDAVVAEMLGEAPAPMVPPTPPLAARIGASAPASPASQSARAASVQAGATQQTVTAPVTSIEISAYDAVAHVWALVDEATATIRSLDEATAAAVAAGKARKQRARERRQRGRLTTMAYIKKEEDAAPPKKSRRLEGDDTVKKEVKKAPKAAAPRRRAFSARKDDATESSSASSSESSDVESDSSADRRRARRGRPGGKKAAPAAPKSVKERAASTKKTIPTPAPTKKANRRADAHDTMSGLTFFDDASDDDEVPFSQRFDLGTSPTRHARVSAAERQLMGDVSAALDIASHVAKPRVPRKPKASQVADAAAAAASAVAERPAMTAADAAEGSTVTPSVGADVAAAAGAGQQQERTMDDLMALLDDVGRGVAGAMYSEMPAY